ncbi:MAG TPA: YbaY family lipoprotein [Paludibaculum sp.]|jgi:putative lipoprotein
MRSLILTALSSALLLIGQAPAAKVTGTATHRQRIVLPPAAVEVKPQDVSRADAPAGVLGKQLIELMGRQAPVPFEITHDPAKIEERLSYSVAARITVDGRPVFISDTVQPVITRGAAREVEIVVVPVGGTRGKH